MPPWRMWGWPFNPLESAKRTFILFNVEAAEVPGGV
jgi:hypothetical protein